MGSSFGCPGFNSKCQAIKFPKAVPDFQKAVPPFHCGYFLKCEWANKTCFYIDCPLLYIDFKHVSICLSTANLVLQVGVLLD